MAIEKQVPMKPSACCWFASVIVKSAQSFLENTRCPLLTFNGSGIGILYSIQEKHVRKFERRKLNDFKC